MQKSALDSHNEFICEVENEDDVASRWEFQRVVLSRGSLSLGRVF